MKVLVTGASGFLGKTLYDLLLKQNIEVYGFTRDNKKGLITVPSYTKLPRFEDAVLVHLAQSRSTSMIYNKSEIDLCRALSARKWSHIVYASSATVYGDRGHLPHMTEDPAYPSNGYTKMKIECEKVFAEVGATCLRFSNLYGFGMSDNSVVADILRQIPGKGPIKIIDPTPIRDYLWIDDAAACLAAACSVKVSKTLNSGSGEALKVGDLVSLVLRVAGEQLRNVVTEKESTNVSCIKLDISKTRSLLSWSPETDLQSGLSKLLKTKHCQPISA